MAANTEKIVVQIQVKGQKDLDNLSKKTGKATKGVGGLTKGFAGMAAGAFAAVAAFRKINEVIGGAIRTFRDFEFQMAKVKAVTGASNKDFAKLSNTAKDLGRSTFFTAQQVAELQTNFGKLGFSTQEILDAQEATLMLATATDVDLGRAAIVAGASIRGFGLDASEAGRVVDVMAEAFTSSALDIEKFQTSMTKVAPIAAGANVSIEATTAVMGVLTDAGIEASIAGTSLRNIFLKMQDSSSDLSKHLGFTVNSSDDLQKALNILNAEGLSNEEIMGLVDLRQVAAFQTMVKGSKRIQDLTVDFNNANGAAKEMSDIVGDTLEGAFKRMTSASQGLAIELTEKLGGGLKDLIDKFAVFINRVTDNSDAIAKGVKIIISIVKWLGIYKLGVIAARVATTAYTGAIVAMRTATITASAALRGFKTALASTGIGLAIVLLGELAAKFLLTSDSASDAALSTNDLADASERLENRAESFNRLVQKQLGGTIKKSKENVKSLKSEITIREAGLIAHKRGLNTMSKLERDASFDEIRRLRNKIALEKKNQKELQDIKNKEKQAKKSLIRIAEEELAIAQKMPETTEAEIRAKNIAIKTIEEEIKRLKELGVEKLKQKDVIVWNPYQSSLDDLKKLKDEDEALAQQQLDNSLRRLELYKEASDAVFSIINDNASRQAGRDEKRLEERKDAGLITEEEYEKGVEKIQRAAFEKKKKMDILKIAIDTALNVGKIKLAMAAHIASLNPVGAAVAATQIPFAIATGVIQAAVVASQKFAQGGMIEEFANGGMVHGNSHANGGEKFAVGGRVVELEGGEAVINKRSTAMFRGQLSAMNAAGGGVKFADGGLLNQPSFTQQQFNAVGQSQMRGAMASGRKVVVVEADITDTQNSVSVIESEATF